MHLGAAKGKWLWKSVTRLLQYNRGSGQSKQPKASNQSILEDDSFALSCSLYPSIPRCLVLDGDFRNGINANILTLINPNIPAQRL